MISFLCDSLCAAIQLQYWFINWPWSPCINIRLLSQDVSTEISDEKRWKNVFYSDLIWGCCIVCGISDGVLYDNVEDHCDCHEYPYPYDVEGEEGWEGHSYLYDAGDRCWNEGWL